MSETKNLPIPTQAPPSKPGRGLRLALALSVALNLAVVGVVAGMAWHGGPGGRGQMPRDVGFGPFEAALQPKDREALRGALRGKLGNIRQARQQMQQDMEAILSALRADPFIPEALSAAMDAQALHLSARLRFGTEVLRDHLLTLTPQERLAFAQRIEAHLR